MTRFEYEQSCGAQQARCPVHDVALAGFLATCPVEGCEWQLELSRMAGQSQQRPDLRQYRNACVGASGNAAIPPEPISYFEADRNHYRDKFQSTQGIRGALWNLWRQMRG